jgi:soluble lytic murein transglycosylase-like protein
MALNEPLIRTGHPPHTKTNIKNGLLFFRILRKVTLFVVIFVLSFHLSNFIPGLNQREQTIKEILEVLERQPTGLANVTKEELAEVIYEEASRHNQDPKFILALIAIESSFQNWSVSEQGAKGLMQIMPYVAESLAQEMGIEWSGDRTLFNPYLNIKIGIHYLSQLIFDFKDIGVALTAYNYGPTYVKGLIERNEKIPPGYYRKFIATYQNI